MNTNRIEAHNIFRRRAGWVALCMSFSLLAACGGGGGGSGGSTGSTANTGGGQTGTTGSAPFIVTQPQAQAVNAGSSATFSLVFDGQAPFTFQWFRDGVAISGATDSTYTLPTAQITDNGAQFSVRISNALGNITSAGAALAVEGTGLRILSGFVEGRGWVDGTGSAARFNTPIGTAVCTDGTQFVTDYANHTIRRITTAGVVTTLAGKAGEIGSANGIGDAARFHFPTGIAADAACANLYVADKDNATIRRIVVASRTVSTIAGTTGVRGATATTFTRPTGIATDGTSLYVADAMDAGLGDTTGNLIRKLPIAGGTITTLAGTSGVAGATNVGAGAFNNPTGIAVDGPNGNVYVADNGNHQIRQVTQPVAPAVSVVSTLAGGAAPGAANGTGAAALFRNPYHVAFGTFGGAHLVVADKGNSAIRKITLPGGVVTTFAGTLGVTGQTDGPDALAPGSAALFTEPHGVATDAAGNVYVTDTSNHTSRRIAGTGNNHVTTVAGTHVGSGKLDGASTTARFDHPTGLGVDTAGNYYVADESNHAIRKVSPTGLATTLAGNLGVAGNAVGTGATATFRCPKGVAVDASGNVYVADAKNHTIRMVTSGGAAITIAGGLAPAANGLVNGAGTAARFDTPSAVALDTAGNVIVADTVNNAIRRIANDAAKTVTTVATFTYTAASPAGTTGVDAACTTARGVVGVAVDGANNIYVADNRAHVIRMITPGGAVSVLAGTAGTVGSSDATGAAAAFNSPYHLVSSGSNLYVADFGNHVIRKVTTAGGVVTTVIGTTGLPGVVQGALPGGLDEPLGLAIAPGPKLAISTVHGIALVNPAP